MNSITGIYLGRIRVCSLRYIWDEPGAEHEYRVLLKKLFSYTYFLVRYVFCSIMSMSDL